MPKHFDPYHVWLGILPQEQPANYYRLLSAPLFESDPNVIDNAADRQMAHLRTLQTGPNSDLSQKLLNEVAAARVCLLDAQKKAAYDRQLRARLAPQLAAAGPAPAQASPGTPSVPVTAPLTGGEWDNLLGEGEGQPHKAAGKSAKALAARRKAKKRPLTLFALAGVLLAAAAGIVLYALNANSADGTLTFEWAPADRSGATLSVDGAPVTIPSSGTWEYHCPPGEHQLAALQPLYKPWNATVTVAPGQSQMVAVAWKPEAVVVLDWPLKDRQGAALKIDGRSQAVSDQEPLEVPVTPGSHVVRIQRTNTDPFQATVEVALDGRRTVVVPPPAVEATLVLRWPADQRSGAQISIDGEFPATARTSAQVVEFALKAGRHTVRITRPGFQPFEQVVELTAVGNKPLVPDWSPELAQSNALAGTLDDAGGAPPGTQSSDGAFGNAPAVKKLPVPSGDEQAKLTKQLDELYKPTRSAKDAAKASELYDLADKSQSPAERYMLWLRGTELAAEAGDAALAFHGIDSIAAEYELEPFEAKHKLLEKAEIAATTAEQLTALIGAAMPLLDQAIAADQYEAALAIAATTGKALGKRPVDAQLRKDTDELLTRRRRDIHMLEPLWAAAQKAQKTLEQTAADPEANLTLGRWCCFYKNDWPRGLPLLAKGKDEKLKALAQAELKPPADANAQVQLADGWFEASPTEIGFVRDAIRLHAGDLYTAALPGLNSPLAKVKIDKRLAEIAKLQRPGAPASVSASSGSAKFPRGRWVDLLRLVNPKRDTVSGTWSRNGQEIVAVAPGRGSRVTVPVVVKGSYDLEIEFTRTSGDDCVGIMVPIGLGSSMVVLSGWGGSASGLMVNEMAPNSPEDPIAVRPGNLENDHRYRLLVSARIVSDNRASLEVSLDGKRYFPNWSGDPATLFVWEGWRMPNPTELGLAANAAVTFHSARLKMVSGTASLDSALLSASH